MSYPLHWDTSTGEQERRPALVVAPVHGVQPFAGSRNPLTRSSVAHRISMSIATPATEGQSQIYHFDGAREMAVALEALLSPELHGLEVQLPPIPYAMPSGVKRHSFDLRLTFNDGYRRAVFVRNGTSLKKRRTQDEIDAIFAATPDDFADDKKTVDGDHYTRAYRDNLLRLHFYGGMSDADADQHVFERARNTSYWLLRELAAKCDLPSYAVWRSAMRLIGLGHLKANMYAVISMNACVWCAE